MRSDAKPTVYIYSEKVEMVGLREEKRREGRKKEERKKEGFDIDVCVIYSK